MRLIRVATVWLVGALSIGAAAAHAQTAASSGSEPRLYVEFNGGPTLGHKSDTFIGGEIGLRLVEGLDVFIEGGHMGNVGTAQLDTAAAKIADFLGGPSPAHYPAASGNCPPIHCKPRSVPTYNRLRAHNDESLFPFGPEPSHQDPEELIEGCQPWPGIVVRQNSVRS